MVHLLPLPGSPGWQGSIDDVLERAKVDAAALTSAGFDALIVENYGDIPFHPGAVPAATVASLTRVISTVRAETDLPLGVNVLRNDAAAAISIAATTDAHFVRVNVHVGAMWTDQGLLQGRADETLRLRRSLGVDVAILADVHVKHAVPPVGAAIDTSAADAWHRGLADALLVTGAATGAGTAVGDLEAVRSAVPDAPVLVASGVTTETVTDTLEHAHGVIVGSDVMRNGRAGTGIDPERARAFVERARG
jgi:membrane complex biogenesis BtpA family protein